MNLNIPAAGCVYSLLFPGRHRMHLNRGLCSHDLLVFAWKGNLIRRASPDYMGRRMNAISVPSSRVQEDPGGLVSAQSGLGAYRLEAMSPLLKPLPLAFLS
jgi:hypothetical protein